MTESKNLSPNDTLVLMPEGSRFVGQPIDNSSRRSARLQALTADLAAGIVDSDYRIVDDVYHRGEFWRALIPRNAVESVRGQAFNFSKPKTRKSANGPEVIYSKYGIPRPSLSFLNHLQSRFTLREDRPAELYPLSCRDFSVEPAHRIHDLIYSLEANGPLGWTFNMKDSLAGNLVSAHRFLSVEEMVFERIVVENMYVTESPPLPLDADTLDALLEASLQRSHSAGSQERYYLLRLWGTNNCTSNPFQIVDTVATYPWRNRLAANLYRLPFNPRLYLRLRGLDSDPSIFNLVRNEFKDFIEAEETRERKRRFVKSKAELRKQHAS